ncbi:MAG TPA: carboxyltransferase domain-containing protein [Acidimicrobiales bacterium]|nr:carboxyltransferase domain-containing protein [Acidimicrobiales bacterium]
MSQLVERSVPVGEVRPLGDHACILGVEDAARGRAVVAAITGQAWPELREAVGGLATVMVAFVPDADPADVGQRLIRLWRALAGVSADDVRTGARVVVPVVFDGPDLGQVAAISGGPVHRVVELLTATPLTVAVLGFSPGFAYLSGLPDALAAVPRRTRPRPTVAAGSVALANGHAAVYPSASPGGWQLIGRTNETFFTPRCPPYARLAPGDQVQFVPVDELPDPQSWTGEDALTVPAHPPGQAVFTVEEAGIWTVLQDAGRPGLAALGVPGAGPADPDSLALANRLVGNQPDAGALEVTARGPTLSCLAATFVAAVGGSPELTVAGQPVSSDRVVPVKAGQRLGIGPVRQGFRSYLAVGGGLVGHPVMGSLATDQLSRLGPGPLRPGQELRSAPLAPPLGDHLASDAVGTRELTGPIVLRVVAGPHEERCAPGALAALAHLTLTVDGDSNRVGLRLRAPAGSPSLGRVGVTAELDSQGVVTGAVQIPPGGDPVILMPDHATMGGYPVLAVVAAVDHGRLGQCAPGDSVRLQPIGHHESRRLFQERQRRLARAVSGHYPIAVD